MKQGALFLDNLTLTRCVHSLAIFVHLSLAAFGGNVSSGARWHVLTHVYDHPHYRFVLYKEKNMLLSQVVLSRRSKVPVPAGDRRQKVRTWYRSLGCPHEHF